jgi:hypothetical protein
MILLSIQNGNQIGISQGFIKSIWNDKCNFILLLDKALDFKNNVPNLFRIDKINYRSSICLNYSNLMKLIEPNEHAAKLREIIIDKKKPEYEKSLPKDYILKMKPYFKNLNKHQQFSIVKSIMAKDYLLIKGYPGTGNWNFLSITRFKYSFLFRKNLDNSGFNFDFG